MDFRSSPADDKNDSLRSTSNSSTSNGSECTTSSTTKRVTFHKEISVKFIEDISVSFSPDVLVNLIPLITTNLQDVWYSREEMDGFRNEAKAEKNNHRDMNDSQVVVSTCKRMVKTSPTSLLYLKLIATTNSFNSILPMLPSTNVTTATNQTKSNKNSFTSHIIKYDSCCLPHISC